MSARARFVAAFIATITNPWARWRAVAQLEAVIDEAQASERRRLCADRAAYDEACALTAREHVTTERIT